MEPAALRAQFPVLRETAYLNAGTCGPLPGAAAAEAAAVARAALDEGRVSTRWEQLLAIRGRLREAYAQRLRARQEDVARTIATSDGVARVVVGLGLGAGDEIVTSTTEHPGLYGPLIAARARGAHVRQVPLAEVRDAVGPRTSLVACSHVDWTNGATAPDLTGLDVPVLLDGAQGVGAIDVDVEALGCSFYAGSGQKWLCGPEGSGMLWVSPDWRERLAPAAPGYLNLAEPGAGLDSEPWPDARAHDAPAVSLETWTAALAAHDVLAQLGWPQVHTRATGLAAQLAGSLRELGLTVAPRGETTLVSWEAPEAADLPARLAAERIVVRSLPGTPYVRASVGAWNDESDLDLLLGAIRGG
jgi:selenocysteine lyase/cysteine desulfurase